MALAFHDASKETPASPEAPGAAPYCSDDTKTPGVASAAQADAKGRGKVEVRILLDPDDGALARLLSALEPQHRSAPAAALPHRLDLPAPLANEALAPIAGPQRRRGRAWISPFALIAALLAGFAFRHIEALNSKGSPIDPLASVRQLVEKIVAVESHGEAAAKNAYSTALGVGQFVEATWLDLIRKHRPDIASSHDAKAILDLRRDAELSRFITSRYAEENASMLARRGLPVTPGSLYLSHFAGPAGAAAILTAPEESDAASVIANVDGRPGMTRDKIISGNPFMKNFTARDLKNWATLKTQELGSRDDHF